MRTVRIVLAGDDRYAMPLAVAARSVVDVVPDLELFVLDAGMTATSRARVEASLGDADTKWIGGLAERVQNLPNTWAAITRAGYARIYAPELIDADRVLYLDCDTLTRRSPVELFDLDLRGNLAMGVPDVQSPHVPVGVPGWFDAGRRADEYNFNSGVLLVDLDGWRREHVTEQLLHYLTDRHLRGQDQEAINAVIGTRIGSLDARWNQQGELFWAGLEHRYDRFLPYPSATVDRLKGDPWIVHYSNKPKPWEWNCSHPLRDEWFATLDRTAWAGWRPAAPSPTKQLIRRVGGKTLRRARKWLGPPDPRVRCPRCKAYFPAELLDSHIAWHQWTALRYR